MKHPIISIIIPVYNVELYLEKCIESVLAQTYKDWELLLIDDGSTDSSRVICDRYALADSRIHVFHKLNGGVSSARNLGIDRCKGEWICFIDSDDWINNEYLETFNVQEADADMYLQGYREIAQDGEILAVHKFSSADDLPTYQIILESELSQIMNSPCFKLYRTSIIKNNKIRFDNRISYGEDHLFSMLYVQHVSKLKQLINTGYNVNRGIEGSLTTKVVPIDKMEYYIVNIYRLQKKLLAKYPEGYNSLLAAFNSRKYSNIIKMFRDAQRNGLTTSDLSLVRKTIGELSLFALKGLSLKNILVYIIIFMFPKSFLIRI